MNHAITLILALTLAAGPAAAQGTFGSKPKQTWNPGGSAGSATAPRSYGVPAPGVPPISSPNATSKIYGAPEPPKARGFEPYKPFTGSSVYSRPAGSGAASGARDCERSVYTNACPRR